MLIANKNIGIFIFVIQPSSTAYTNNLALEGKTLDNFNSKIFCMKWLGIRYPNMNLKLEWKYSGKIGCGVRKLQNCSKF